MSSYKESRVQTIALVGNPNCGKTTLFNALTGGRQQEGNFPGVTVERKEGTIKGTEGLQVMDLPGLYSLTPYTEEERVAVDYLKRSRPDCILNVVDAVNPQRNLYLTLQLLELERPMIVALNRMDAVRAAGGSVDEAALAQEWGVPVIPVSAAAGDGVPELIRQLQAGGHRSSGEKMEARLREKEMPADGTDPATQEADRRYRYIEVLCRRFLRGAEQGRSSRVDAVLLHPVWGLPIFFTVMAAIFWITFQGAGPWVQGWFDAFLGWAAGRAEAGIRLVGAPGWACSFLIGGIGAGLQSVLSFLPMLLLLFFCLSFLEDSGYMARAAFLWDGLLEKLGLSGRCIVPLLMGFGCSVPAIMACRTLREREERRRAVFFVPFMSCSAKLPVYGLLARAFFPRNVGWIVLGAYGMGILFFVITGLFLRSRSREEERSPLVLELPEYRLPQMAVILRQTGQRAGDFLRKVFTVILGASAAIWLLSHFNTALTYTPEEEGSLLAELGCRMAPIFAPAGFGDWRAAAALITGLIAKESIVSTLTVLGGGETGLALWLPPAGALALLTFTALYMPCAAAFGAQVRELGSFGRAVWNSIRQTALAYAAAVLVYTVARLLI